MTKPIIATDISSTIRNFKNRAPGESKINKTILSKLPEAAVNRLQKILNLALSMGLFMEKFKSGIINLVGKEGKDPRQPENYRPITLLEVPGKLFENIINDRFSKYLEEHALLPEHQYGFRKGRGTDVALTTIYENVAVSQTNKWQCNVVCRDITKAFDKVWIKGLQYKILQLNLPEPMERILCNFMDNRIAKLRVGNLVGPPFPLESGVPQGSILSPTLFIFYTADAPRAGPGCLNIQFADDVTQIITYPHRSTTMMALKTEREIKTLNEYE